MYPDTFEGFQVDSAETWTTFHKREVGLPPHFPTASRDRSNSRKFVANSSGQIIPKPLEDNDVEIQIQACGVCGSDVHTITGGWGAQHFPLAVGHEIIGKALRVGPKVTLVKPGQRVGLGAQLYSCLECKQCKNDNETYCVHQVDTYGAVWPDTGIVTQGGYSSHVRAHEVFPLLNIYFSSPVHRYMY
jgi:alcohol dehydrogenase (NADP+)